MEFPHLKDTQFPHLNTENVWQYRNTFDYTRWGVSTTLRLCTVNYTPDYSHVVEWENASARDSYFDNLSTSYATQLNEPVRLESAKRTDARVHSVRVPVPFDVASRYNYLQVTLSEATSPGQRLNYETDEGVRVWYFFINDAIYRAPSATELELELDIWTSFFPYIDIQGYMLERGHAPVALAHTPSEFLSAPYHKTDYLLASDIEVSGTGEIKQGKPLTFEGEKIYCFTLPYTPTQLSGLTAIPNQSGDFTNPEYYNTGERNGYQKGVRGYEWQVSGKDYDNATALSPTVLPSGGAGAKGYYVYGVNATGAPAFFNTLRDNNLNVLRDIGAVFALNKNWISITQTFTLYNTEVYYVEPSPVAGAIGSISFTEEDFGFPEEYKRFTKLYTSPYCTVTVSDNVGNIHELNVQDLTGETGVQVRAIISQGVFKTLATIINMNATGTVAYNWTNANGENVRGNLPLSQFDAFLFENDIPLYQINISALSNWEIDNYASAHGTRLSALTSYKNSVASTNNNYENTLDSADVSYSNATSSARTSYTNAVESANTGYTNAVNSANTDYTNAVNSANTGYTNASASANTAYTNASASATTAYNNTVRSNQATTDNTALTSTVIAANQARLSSYATLSLTQNNSNETTLTTMQNALQNQLLDIETEARAATSITSGIASVASAIASGPQAVVSAGIGAIANGVNAAIEMGAKADEVTAQNNYRTNSTAQTHSSVINVNAGQAQMGQDITEANNINSTMTTRNTVNASNANANASRNTAIANADRTRNTTIANAGRTRATSIANSGRSRDTAIANAGRSRDTSIANAGRTRDTSLVNAGATRDVTKDNALYTRDTSIENAKRTFETAQDVYNYSRTGARLGKTLALTSASGDTTRQILGLEGYTARLSTPKNDNVRRLGDYFARYGYASGEYFTRGALQKMKNFTYLKADDIQLVSKGADANACYAIRAIMEQGITVWSDPEKVNAVSIYENWS